MKNLILATTSGIMFLIAAVLPGTAAAQLTTDTVTVSVKIVDGLTLSEETALIARNGGREKYDIEVFRQLEAQRISIKQQLEELENEHGGTNGLLAHARNAAGVLTMASVKARLAVIKHDRHANDERRIVKRYFELLGKIDGNDTAQDFPHDRLSRVAATYANLADALRIHVVSVPLTSLPLVLQSYKTDPQVESIEIVKTRHAEGIPDDSDYGVQWALSKIGWESVFNTVTLTGSATVALLDTGVDATHPDLAENVITGRSILDGSNGLTDPSGHGTRMAGIIAAVTDNNIGIAGVASTGVKVMPVTVLDATGSGQDSDIIAGIIWAVNSGADVILMPFSNPDYSQHLQDAIDYAWNKGAVLVAATGNSALNSPTFPSGDRGVIGVSASDQNDFLAPFSNTGANVFLAAPGVDIYTTDLSNSYSYISGTSTSSAIVAGVAAFMKAADPTLTNGIIADRLADSADPIGTAADPDNLLKYGHGRVNMANALKDSSIDATQPAGVAGSGNGSVGTYQAAAAYTWSVVGTYTWTAPANVTEIVVRLWGGGGGGGGTLKNTTSKGGGGAGGQYVQKVVSVIPNTTYTVVAGAGGTANVGNGTTGGDSTFAATTAVAKGGGGGQGFPNNGKPGHLALGGLGSTAGGVGDIVYRGGNGSDGTTDATGGAGGGGAGTTGDGGNAAGNTAGSGTSLNGGSGGQGLASQGDGNAGNVAGGGGGGGYATSRPNSTGGIGADGRVEITYNQTITFGALPAKIYGDADFAPAATASSGLTVTYSSSNTSVATIVSGNIHITGAGTAIIYADQAGDVSYNSAPQVSQTLTVTARPITVTADLMWKVDGAADPSPLTYQITSGSLVGSDTFSGSLSRVGGETVGAYAINQNTLTAGSNYILTYVGNTFYIDALMTMTQPNCTIVGPTSARVNTTPHYDITPLADYKLIGLKIDGVLVMPYNSYTFAPVTASHSIAAYTVQVFPLTASMVFTGGCSGVMKPVGVVNIPIGGYQGYAMKPNSGCRITDIKITGGVSIPVTNPTGTNFYTFSNITGPQTIEVTFGP